MDSSLKIEIGNKYFDLINHRDDSGNHLQNIIEELYY